jgi:hypothetical protein
MAAAATDVNLAWRRRGDFCQHLAAAGAMGARCRRLTRAIRRAIISTVNLKPADIAVRLVLGAAVLAGQWVPALTLHDCAMTGQRNRLSCCCAPATCCGGGAAQAGDAESLPAAAWQRKCCDLRRETALSSCLAASKGPEERWGERLDLERTLLAAPMLAGATLALAAEPAAPPGSIPRQRAQSPPLFILHCILLV